MRAIIDFHAHIYFDAEEADDARRLGEAALEQVPGLRMGRVHTVPVGPHPRGSCQLTVPFASFAPAAVWLLEQRGSLTIFMHANTGDDLADHTRHVIWLGDSETLDLTVFARGG